MTKPMKKMLIYVGIFFLIVFGWFGIKIGYAIWQFSGYQPPPITVSATEAKTKPWQLFLTTVGTLTAINGVDLAADVPGIVSEIHFNSGQFVKRGDVLIVLDTDVEKADLKSNQAKLKLAQISYERDKKLLQKNAASQSIVDASFAQLQQAEAGVETVLAKIKQKTITAPFDGRVGIRLIDIGQYVSPGKMMVTLQAINPLYVSMNLPEQNLSQLYMNQPVDITANFGNGKTVRGKITAINSKVDQVTRNILIQATIPNDKMELYPGMFASTKVWLKGQLQAIVVPQTAISYSLHGDYVFLIKSEGKTPKESTLHAYRQYVKVGERRGDEAAIIQGLKSGDKVEINFVLEDSC